MRVIRFLINFLATGFYSGYSPRMPGTCGTAVAFVLIYLLYQLVPELGCTTITLCSALVVILVAIMVSNAVYDSRIFGEDVEDPQQVVIDEFAGYFVTIIGAGVSFFPLLIGFVLFRLFDIWKPPPVRNLEKLPRGYGIVFDDVAAGVYALIVLQIALAIF